jgi:hypothetical protein
MYRGVTGALQTAIVSMISGSGALTDELTYRGLGRSFADIGATGDLTDERVLNEAEAGGDLDNADPYKSLQIVRARAIQAIGLLTAYAPDVSPALRGQVYTFEGYAELMLAELYCSGVPLSTLDFQGDFTYQPGSSQADVYQHALALFDSALAISSDSASIVALASVGRGRVLLDLGRYAEAAQSVTAVPTAFQYQIQSDFGRGASNRFEFWSVASHEGINGLPFATDPRSLGTWTPTDTNAFGVLHVTPVKYALGAVAPVVIASGVEARLIEAEAFLNANSANPNPAWLTLLNTLRTDGTNAPVYTRQCTNGILNGQGQITQPGSPCPAGMTDVKWGWGAGAYLLPASVLNKTTPSCPAARGTGVPCFDTTSYIGLPPLTDPALGIIPTGRTAFDVRLDLVLRERAYWLFLTGHRQGDLRRVVRHYGRPQNMVYPTGSYYGGLGSYGRNVNIPIPGDERINPLFHGCLDRAA